MRAEGVNARAVMETLGHSQISITLGIYAHMLGQSQAAAARKMNRVLGG